MKSGVVGRWSRVAALALAVGMVAGEVRGQVMSQVPDNAMVVVRVASLSATSKKVAGLAQKIGIAQMVPQLQDPLGALKQKLEDPKGMNDQGEMAFVYLNPDSAGGDPQKSMIALLPVTDYQAFVGNIENGKTEGDVTEGKFHGKGETQYVAHWGDYAAVGPSRELVAKKPAGTLKTAGVTGKELAEKDIVVYANFAQIRAKAIPALQQNRQKILAKIEKGITEAQQRQAGARAGANAAGDNAAAGADKGAAAGAGANPQAAAAVKAMVNQGLNVAQQLLQDTEAVTWGINLGDDGIKGSLVAEFAGNSYVGQLASGSKNTDEQLLAGLPSGNYLFLMGARVEPERATKLINDISGPIVKELKTAGVDTAVVEKYVESVKQFYGNQTRIRMGIVAPTGGIGQEALFQSVGVIDGNAGEVMAAMRGMSESQAGFTKLLGQPEDQTKVTITANAKTIDGVAFDQVQTTFNFGANNPAAAQAQQMIAILYGPNGFNMLSGKVDEKHVVMTTGANDELVGKVVKAAKEGQDAVGTAEGIKAVNAQLPASRLAVMYIPVDQMVSTGVSYAKQFGMPVQVQLPPNLPPIGAALSTEGSAYRLDGYLPAQLVQSLVSAGMQAFMAMQGGGAQPGGPGGL